MKPGDGADPLHEMDAIFGGSGRPDTLQPHIPTRDLLNMMHVNQSTVYDGISLH